MEGKGRLAFTRQWYTSPLGHPSFHLVSRGGFAWLEVAPWARFSWLAHGFSTRLAGAARDGGTADFSLGNSGSAKAKRVLANRRRFAAALGEGFSLAGLSQVHSATVYEAVTGEGAEAEKGESERRRLEYRAAGWPLAAGGAGPAAAGARVGAAKAARAGPAGENSAAGDALVTSERGVLLSIRTADCLPVLIADSRRRVVAAVHAGWRGALERVIEKTAGELRRLYGSIPADLTAAIGPGIGACCYEVGDEVVEAFRGRFVEGDAFFRKPPADDPSERSELRYQLLFHTQAPPGHRRERARLHLDLSAVARAQLLAAGLKPARVHACDLCTSCRADLFYSFRRDGARAGRMMAVIGVRP